MDTSSPTPQKKGLGALAWLGIGCGGIVVLGIIAVAVAYFMFGDKVKEMAADAQKNPARFAATTLVNMGGGQIEMVAQDDVNKRYTVRDKRTSKETTFYWNQSKNVMEQVDGGFSAIPAESSADSTPVPTVAPK